MKAGATEFLTKPPIAERTRKTGGTTIRSVGQVARLQRILDNDAGYVEPMDMLAELREDNQTLAARLRELHGVVEEYRDIATASLIENWIDETERRAWFLRNTRSGRTAALSNSLRQEPTDRHRDLVGAGLQLARLPITGISRTI